jgi:hypothetical protein
MSQRIEGSSENVDRALADFDQALPSLAKLRHVTMHFDEYALETDKRRNVVGDPARLIVARDLWDLRTDANGFCWLEARLEYDRVEHAARSLYDAIQVDNNTQLE